MVRYRIEGHVTLTTDKEREPTMQPQQIIGWIKIIVGAAAAAAGAGLLHIDPSYSDFLLAFYALMSGGNNVKTGAKKP